MFLPLWQSGRKEKVYLLWPQNCILPNRNPQNCVKTTNQNWVPEQKPRGALALHVNRIADLTVKWKRSVELKPEQTMDLVAELNNEDTKKKKFQVFKNVSFDSRTLAVISKIVYFVMTRNARLFLRFCWSSFIWSY